MAIRRAVVVGTDKCRDERIHDLRFAVEDARRVANALENVGFETRFLHDASDRHILAAVDRMVHGLGERDLFVLYFSGHGVSVDSRHLLLCEETRHALLRHGRGGLWVDELKDATVGFGGHRAFILDTCREPLLAGRGAQAQMRDTESLRTLVQEESTAATAGGLTIFCSCDENDTAQESESLGQGLFSRALTEQLGEAARKGLELRLDGSLAEALGRRMRELATDTSLDLDQRPWVQTCGPPPVLIEGDNRAWGSAGHTTQRLAVLSIGSEPPGATFLLDGGQWEGRAPCRLTRIPWGTHHCLGELAGESVEEEFKISGYRHALELRFPGTAAAEDVPEHPDPSPGVETRVPSPPPLPSLEPSAGDVRTVELPGGVALELVWCPPGEFAMGSPEDESGRSENEGPQHLVTFASGFWLGKLPVTQAQWESVTGDRPSRFRGCERPVERISWDDCQDFLKELNSRTSAGTFRLPSEAEWEYACRAGTTSALYTGEELTEEILRCPRLDPIAWYLGTSGGKTHSVGKLAPNAWGLHDMLGNVWEWCSDQWQRTYTERRASGTEWQNGRARRSCVNRGGTWDNSPQSCRSASRAKRVRGRRSSRIGLRLALPGPCPSLGCQPLAEDGEGVGTDNGAFSRIGAPDIDGATHLPTGFPEPPDTPQLGPEASSVEESERWELVDQAAWDWGDGPGDGCGGVSLFVRCEGGTNWFKIEREGDEGNPTVVGPFGRRSPEANRQVAVNFGRFVAGLRDRCPECGRQRFSADACDCIDLFLGE